MRLLSLSMQNFRQHAASLIHFAPGLTGIIGANGSGKSTILEGIAFALYGQPAARGKKESIKFLRAQPRASVRVELTFELAGHRYRVVRGLSSAECYLDDADAPIANTLTGVTDMLQRVLGMSREEFFCTYFTGQKELAMMATMSPTDRGKFLSRVLGYDRIGLAQESARDRRRLLVAELSGLRSTLQDGDVIARNVKEATERVAAANADVVKWSEEHTRALGVVAGTEPAWRDAQARQETTHRLTLERQAAAQQVTMHERDIVRLDAMLAQLQRAEADAIAQRTRIVDLPALRAEAEAMDASATAHATRQNLLGIEAGVQHTLERVTAHLAQLLEGSESALADRVALLRGQVREAESRYDDARDAWTRDAATARGELEALRDRHESLTRQKASLVALGDESPCATCGQRIGARFATVLQELTDAIESVAQQGLAARARVNALAAPPAEVAIAQSERGAMLLELQTAEQQLANLTAAQSERARLLQEQAAAEERLATVRQSLSQFTSTYDAAVHQALRARIDELTRVESHIAVLDEQLAGREAIVQQRTEAQSARKRAQEVHWDLDARVATEGIAPAAFMAARDAHVIATNELAIADGALSAAVNEQARAEEALGYQRAAQARFAELRERVAMMEHERFVLEETDRGYTDLRATLNASLRPELAEIASELLDTLTDGRYTQADIDETYTLTVLEDGLAKPVLSGGEEDLCNLILRLAISQMIAQRAGHVFSLLILDEVFGALDDARRANVMELLRRLNDRFAQVIVITHLNQVRDALDSILQVRYDAETGSSVIVSDVPTEDPALAAEELAA